MESRRVSSRGITLLAGVVLTLTLAAFVRPGSSAQDGYRTVSNEQSRVHHRQFGLASYYGPGFQGEETASGEEFDMREMVAAHRTLPLGSIVRVTNLDNGRSIVVRVIDRGPYGKNYRKGTIIDVSKGAARRLRFIHDGLVPVQVEVIKEGNNERK